LLPHGIAISPKNPQVSFTKRETRLAIPQNNFSAAPLSITNGKRFVLSSVLFAFYSEKI
jgi:hypothetical protein